MSVGPRGSCGQLESNTLRAITWRNVMIRDNKKVRVAVFLISIFLLSEPDNRFFINVIVLDICKIQALRHELN